MHHKSDGAFLYIGIGNGKRHALAFIVYTDDYKVACLAALCNQRSLYLKKKNFLRELFLTDDFEH